MRAQYPLPGDTQRVVQRFNLAKCRNPGLIFARYAPDWQTDATLKKAGLEAVRDAKPEEELLRALRQRWYTVVTAYQAELFQATTSWRLIVGLGQKGPLEVGFTFHRLYGVPVVPGSALKGLARAYAYLVEARDEDDPSVAAIFGRAPKPGEDERVARAGEAIFFDAIPWDDPELELDVMNPHYPNYYRGEEPPAAWQDPRPVYFLALKPGLRFAFAVGWRGSLDKEGFSRRRLAVEWLQKGLQELGAGAKTSAGYGYFTAVAPLQRSPSP